MLEKAPWRPNGPLNKSNSSLYLSHKWPGLNYPTLNTFCEDLVLWKRWELWEEKEEGGWTQLQWWWVPLWKIWRIRLGTDDLGKKSLSVVTKSWQWLDHLHNKIFTLPYSCVFYCIHLYLFILLRFFWNNYLNSLENYSIVYSVMTLHRFSQMTFCQGTKLQLSIRKRHGLPLNYWNSIEMYETMICPRDLSSTMLW